MTYTANHAKEDFEFQFEALGSFYATTREKKNAVDAFCFRLQDSNHRAKYLGGQRIRRGTPFGTSSRWQDIFVFEDNTVLIVQTVDETQLVTVKVTRLAEVE